jgi:spermidine synthase
MNNGESALNFRSGKYLPFFVLLFFGSGCAALIYEVIWLQMLQLVIGLTSLSLGILLGTFMGGMCLGSLLFPRLISAENHPLRVYAFLEFFIGVSGLILLFTIPLIGNLYTGIAGHGVISSVLFRSLIAAICILPPTILMGATLPAISRWVEATPEGVSWMGFFYGGNIFGAVAGCLLSGFYLLRVFDVETATWVAFFLNLIIATGAMFISRITTYNHSRTDPETQESYSRGVKVVYITIALSGMAALGGEVIWTRLLSIMMGSTVYTFSIILAAFLIGLGIGSGTGAYLSRKIKSPGLALAICQFLLILAITWASHIITNKIPYRALDLTRIADAWHLFRNDLMWCILAVLPPALFWGASFPLALAAAAIRGEDPGRLVGRVYASNTIGAIAGSLGFSMIGIPFLGSGESQKILIILSGSAAIIMIAHYLFTRISTEPLQKNKPKSFINIRTTALITAIIVVVALVISNITTIPWGAVAYGRYMSSYGNLEGINKTLPEPPAETVKPLYVGEGLNGTVAVTLTSTGITQFHSVGKVQASTEPLDMRLQRMLGHITALLTEKPESVLVIGCGAGITAGTFVTYPEVKKIVVCDIESLIPRLVAPMFSKVNYGIADGISKQNPHLVKGKEVRFEYDDGRHYIRTSDEKFDIISSDPIDPWGKGAGALYTLEYFESCKSHLKPGGSMSLWVPLYQGSPESVKSMISTFFRVFPEGIIWSNDNQGTGYDIVLFGQKEHTVIDIEKLNTRFSSEEYAQVRQSLADIEFYSLQDLLITYAGRASDMKEWMSGSQTNTDKNMRLSYLSGLAANTYAQGDIFFEICKYYKFPLDLFSVSREKQDALDQRIQAKMR